MQEAAQAQGYALMAFCDEDAAQLTQWLSEWEVAGVLWRSANHKLAEWINLRFPLVQVGRRMMPEADAILVNQEESMEIALKYLYARGQRRIYAYQLFIKKIGASPYLLEPFFTRRVTRGRRVDW